MPSDHSDKPSQVAVKVRFVTVEEDDSGQRLDNFLLRHLKGVPKSRVYRIIRKGEVRVNKGRVSVSYRLQAGDLVRIPPVRMATKPVESWHPPEWREQLSASILYEDDDLLVFNKPSGLAVHGGSGLNFGVIEVARGLYPQCKNLELAHRLDRETSGCLLLTKNRASLRHLHEQFRERKLLKRYLTILSGRWRGGARVIDEPLRKNVRQGGERMVMVASDGKSAQTRFSPLWVYGDISLMSVKPVTGRTHQIRVHAACAGHAIEGDAKYGTGKTGGKLFLHARELAITHPKTGEEMKFFAPVDSAWLELLGNL